MRSFIPVAEPALVGNERKYVLDCLDSTWISSNGIYIERFETEFAGFCKADYAISCCNGTVALHLALLALDVGIGDEILVPDLTFVATANAVVYCGARPVFLESEPATWNIDEHKIEEAITERTKGIIVVHLFGHPANMDPILAIARKHGLFVVEDAAEAHGARYKGKPVGALGDIATFSFYGNKILTTGEGGMVTTDNSELAERVRRLRGQGLDPTRRYWFPEIGYNYRLTNVAAAIGLGQLENVEWHLSRRKEIAEQYESILTTFPGVILQEEKPWAESAHWMNSILLGEALQVSRNVVMQELLNSGIETRPFFYPMHTLPIYEDMRSARHFPVVERLAGQGINLPSSATLSGNEIAFICDQIRRILENPTPRGRPYAYSNIQGAANVTS